MSNNNSRNLTLSEEDARFVANLIEENAKHINNIIHNTLGYENRYLAEDTISEFYLLTCKKAAILKSHPCPKAWVLVAAKRTAQGMIAKNKNQSSSVPLNDAVNASNEADVLDIVIYDIWLENKVPEKLIAMLTKREREIYYKIYIEGKKPKEVAKELNIAASSVNNIHKNLRDKIKSAIKNKNF